MKVKYLAIALAVAVVLYIGFKILAGLVLSGTFEKEYSRKDAIENYIQREQEITDLVNYFNSKVPNPETNKGVSFGLGKSSNRFGLGVFLLDGSVLENYPNVGGSDLELNSAKMDSLLTMLGWTKEVITTLKEKLEKSNCENIKSEDGESLAISFKYSGWGLHSYLIFDRPLQDSLITWYKSNGDTLIGKNVVIRFSSAL